MEAFLSACKQANEEISGIFSSGCEAPLFEKGKVGAGGDVSSGMDMMAEKIFVKYLGSFGRIESEESGMIGEGDASIIIDPLDGSSNALSLFPYYGTSVARINSRGVLDAAMVCNLGSGDIFMHSEEGKVVQGKLFEKGFHEPRVAPRAEIGLFEKAYAHPEIVAALDESGLKFRAPGAVALSLAYARTVNFVLYVGSYRIYDFAAGLALCEGLEVIVEEEYVIVSKDKSIADKIEKLVNNAKKGTEFASCFLSMK